MTKNFKIAAIVSAAAMLVIGASMTSFAATGWQEENGTWVYYDRYGAKVTSTWEKSGNNWFWLDDNGDMATDSLIEDGDYYYYVDSNGAMVTNNWVQMDNSDDDDEDAPATVWYYFQNTGKAYKASTSNKTSFKTINGKKYAFDSDSKMLFGWIDEDTSTRQTGDDAWKEGIYYCGDENDGAQMYNSWGHIHVVDDREDDEDQDYWFYFGSNGKKVAKTGSNENKVFIDKTIGGKKYTFDRYGKMLSEWVATGSFTDQEEVDNNHITSADQDASPSNFKYYSDVESGARMTRGWFRVLPSAYLDYSDSDNADSNVRWFYADGSGWIYHDAIKTINGKKYGFDAQGEMVAGLRWVTDNGDNTYAFSGKLDNASKVNGYTNVDDDDDSANMCKTANFLSNSKTGIYWFSGDEANDGAMKTGVQNFDIDGDSYSFKFKTDGTEKGKGIQGLDNKMYYVNGRKVKATADEKFVVYTYDDTTKVMVKQNVKTLFDSQTTIESTSKYKGNKGTTQDATFVADYAAGTNYIVLSSQGTKCTSGTKKDGDSYKIVVKNSQIYGIYYDL
jgi:glucan-binding YG repeat protein